MQSSELGKHSEGIELTNCRKMSNAVGVWIKGQESYPGWSEWKQESIKRTLLAEDLPLPESDNRVESLASKAAMSVSAFHHNFKAVTSTSPLQYLKSYRLHKARMMMIHDGMKASAAAMRVGYESASQFSREFKRFFGVTPGEDAARMRMMQGS